MAMKPKAVATVGTRAFACALLLLAFVGIASAEYVVSGYTMNGSNVYWQGGNYTITASPAYSVSSNGQHSQVMEFISDNSDPLVANFSFVFPTHITSGDALLWSNVSHPYNQSVYGRINKSVVVPNVTGYTAYNVTNTSQCTIGDINNTLFYNVKYLGGAASGIACFNSYEQNGADFTLYYQEQGFIGNQTIENWYYDWVDISTAFTYQNISGYDVFTINDVTFNLGTYYKMKLDYTTDPTSTGKYYVYVHTGSPDDVVNNIATVYLILDPWWSVPAPMTNWWNASYGAVKQVNVSGWTCDAAYCQFPVALNVTGSIGGGADIRVIASNGTTELDFWREDGWNYASSSGNLWVNASNNTTSFFVYYQASGVSDKSSIDATFPFGDDFSGSSINTSKEQVYWGSGTTTVGSGNMVVTGSSHIFYGFNATTYPITSGTAVVGINGCTGAQCRLQTLSTSAGTPDSNGGINTLTYNGASNGRETYNGAAGTANNSDWSFPEKMYITFNGMNITRPMMITSTGTVISHQAYDGAGTFASAGIGVVNGQTGNYSFFVITSPTTTTPTITVGNKQTRTLWKFTALPYKQQINVTDWSCAASYCQFPINITLNSTVTNGTDIRVVDATETTELGFWREDGWNYTSASGNLWVNASNNTARIVVYYGNTAVADKSSMDNTFIFGDTFDGASLNASKGWDDISSGNGAVSVSGGSLSMVMTSGEGNNPALMTPQLNYTNLANTRTRVYWSTLSNRGSDSRWTMQFYKGTLINPSYIYPDKPELIVQDNVYSNAFQYAAVDDEGNFDVSYDGNGTSDMSEPQTWDIYIGPCAATWCIYEGGARYLGATLNSRNIYSTNVSTPTSSVGALLFRAQWNSWGTATADYILTTSKALTTPTFAFGAQQSPTVLWWNTSWTAAIPIDINTSVASDLVNFPAKVTLDTSNSTLWNTTTCTNVRFVDFSTNAVLSYDLDSADPTFCGNATNNATFWVSGNWTGGMTNRIYAYLGNTGAASGEDETGVWRAANYVGVYHMNENTTGTGFNNGINLVDSAGYNNMSSNWTKVNNDAPPKSDCPKIVNQIGYAINFTGSCGFTSEAATGYGLFKSTKTQSVWTEVDTYSNNEPIMGIYNNGQTREWTMKELTSGQLATWNFDTDLTFSTYLAPLGTEGYSSLSYNGDSTHSSYNGTTSNTQSSTLQTGDAARVHIGSLMYYNEILGGMTIAEARFRNETSTADWLAAEAHQTASAGAIETNAPNITNTAPVITAITVSPASPTWADSISCNITVTDAESATTNITGEWYKNGANQTGLAFTYADVNNSTATIISTLTSGNLSKGENWSCGAIAFDGENYSSWNYSSNVTIAGVVGADECGTLSAAGTYNLTDDITVSGTTCFTITANNVIIDCAGHTILGDNTSSTYGVKADGGYSGAVVKNCNIDGFDTGVYFNTGVSNSNGAVTTGGGTIQNSTVNSGIGYAVNLRGTDGNTGAYLIEGSTITSNSNYALYMYSRPSGIVANSTLRAQSGTVASTNGNYMAISFVNNTFESGSKAGDLLDTGNGCVGLGTYPCYTYWNNFTETSGYYKVGADYQSVIMNYSVGGHGEGNIYFNVMDATVKVYGTNNSTGYPSLYYGIAGAVPYSSANSGGKISGGASDAAPLTPYLLVYGDLTVNYTAGGSATGGNSTFMPPANLTINATASAGYYFVNWTTDCNGTLLSATNANTKIEVLDATACYAQANFAQYGKLTVNYTTGGTATGNNSTIIPPANLTINATKNVGYDFANWTVFAGNCTVLNDTNPNTQIEVLDTTDCEVQAGFTITNAPPNITSISLTPSVPHPTTSELNCTFHITDVDSANGTVSVKWYQNDAPEGLHDIISSWANDSTITAGLTGVAFVKNDVWRCEINATDGIDSTAAVSNNVTITNVAPNITVLNLTPTTVYASTPMLNCTFNITDVDSANGTVAIKWYQNGTPEVTHDSSVTWANGSQIISSLVNVTMVRGDTWGCTINVSDGVDNTIASSNNVTVVNQLPVVNSVSILTAPFYANSTLHGWANVSDSDAIDNPLNVTYTWFLNGAANSSGNLNLSSGVLTNVANISSGLTDNQNWTLQIAASDGINTTYLNSSVAEIENAPPSIPVQLTPANGATLAASSANLTWNASFDLDNDTINYTVCYGTTNATTTCANTSNLWRSFAVSANTTYYWKVQASDGIGVSGYSAIRTFKSISAPAVTSVSTLPQPFIYGDNIGCAFNLSSALSNVSVTVWMQSGNGTIPTAGIHSYNITPNGTFSYPSLLPSTYYSPLEFWRCGVNASGTFNTTAYSNYYAIDLGAATISPPSGGGGGYTPPTQVGIVKNVTANFTKAAGLPAFIGAYGMTFSTASLTEPVAGNLMLAHVALLVGLILLAISFSFNKGILRFVKYVIMVALVLGFLLLLPILTLPKV